MQTNRGPEAVQANKRVVAEFFQHADRNGLLAALDTVLPECRFWSVAGVASRDQMRAFVEKLSAQLAGNLRFEVGAMTAEEDRVAVEAGVQGTRKSGVQYANTYHFLFRLQEGRIVEVREHCDTAHAAAVWGDLL